METGTAPFHWSPTICNRSATPQRVIRWVWIASVLGVATFAQAVPEVEIVFLDGRAAADAFTDETTELYFKLLQPLEMSAKTGEPVDGDLAVAREETRNQYRGSVRSFTDSEKKVVRWYVERCHRALIKDYPAAAAFAWKFIKAAQSIEGGLPHTRGESIVLSPGVLAHMRAMHKRSPNASALMLMGRLMVHERVHVYQRRSPKRFEKLYEAWGFIRAQKIEADPWLRQHQIVNPDAVDLGWVYPSPVQGTTYLWPRVILRPKVRVAKMPQDMQKIVVLLEKDGDGFSILRKERTGAPQTRSLTVKTDAGVAAYLARFVDSRHAYHPNEISADLFSRVVVVDHFATDGFMPAARRKESQLKLAAFKAAFRKYLSAEGSTP